MQIKDQVEKYIDIYSTDETQAKAMRLALVFTGVLWLVMLIILAISPGWHKQKKYKTVRIMLEPAVELKSDKSVASAAAASAPSPVTEKKAETKASAQKNTSQPAPKKEAPKPVAKPAEAPKAAAEPKKASFKIKESAEDAFAKQTAAQNKKQYADWDNMDFVENKSSSSSSSSTAKSVSSNQALSGSAASSSGNNAGVSTKNEKTSAGTKGSEATSSSLEGIQSAQYSLSAANGLKSSVSAGVNTNSDGKLALALTDGSSRVLLSPSKPYIKLSDESASLIDATKNVVISFRILPSGNVPLADIQITPYAVLHNDVQAEIKEQISKWRFAAAATDGQARFDYSIIKK